MIRHGPMRVWSDAEGRSDVVLWYCKCDQVVCILRVCVTMYIVYAEKHVNEMYVLKKTKNWFEDDRMMPAQK